MAIIPRILSRTILSDNIMYRLNSYIVTDILATRLAVSDDKKSIFRVKTAMSDTHICLLVHKAKPF